MSGGSLDYAYGKVDDIAEDVARRAIKPLHRAFAAHLRLVATALHDLEWMLSGDTSEPAEEAAIRACLSRAAVTKQITAEARQLIVEMREELAKQGIEV